MMATNRGHRLTLDNITQRFNDFTAVHDISLDVAGGELVALLGPSGCGKSTLLRIMSGFIQQTEGRVLFDDQPVDHLSPSQRGVGIVFQNYALFPHMTVAENVAYGLQARKWPRDKIAGRVDEMLDLVHVALGQRYAQQSGAARQMGHAVMFKAQETNRVDRAGHQPVRCLLAEHHRPGHRSPVGVIGDRRRLCISHLLRVFREARTWAAESGPATSREVRSI